ncbi:hypothetical protein GCM10010145_37900 [Streptomyces ruber]|uniref:Uncharacterized protein n=2 Tax=Streptomyces TaxID=1883 RepID=A0A918BF99_9ACTN|nr:hypothetical protein GCM10010145_37900 [Streptomyces ruber]
MATGHYPAVRERARWAPESYIRRTRDVRTGIAGPIKVRNAHEMVLWWDAQVPDLSREPGQAV